MKNVIAAITASKRKGVEIKCWIVRMIYFIGIPPALEPACLDESPSSFDGTVFSRRPSVPRAWNPARLPGRKDVPSAHPSALFALHSSFHGPSLRAFPALESDVCLVAAAVFKTVVGK